MKWQLSILHAASSHHHHSILTIVNYLSLASEALLEETSNATLMSSSKSAFRWNNFPCSWKLKIISFFRIESKTKVDKRCTNRCHVYTKRLLNFQRVTITGRNRVSWHWAAVDGEKTLHWLEIIQLFKLICVLTFLWMSGDLMYDVLGFVLCSPNNTSMIVNRHVHGQLAC